MSTSSSVLDEPVAGVAVGSGETYRPHLDGLRAIAVYLVVLFHAGSGPFSGGYVGVDVFFVLSGFLVTQLLLRDFVGLGHLRFGRFYARRFRRLLPAAFVVLLVTGVVYAAIASPAEVLAAVGSFRAAFLYSTNWYFVHTSAGYFGADISTNPVLHFWSLAVEEQFYLLWPLVLGGLFVLTRGLDPDRRLKTVRTVIVVGTLASAVWALSLRSSDPNRAYYGTDTRAYELLGGAFLALVPGWFEHVERFGRRLRMAAVASVGLLLVLASSLVHFDAIVRGVLVTVTTCLLLLAVEAADGGLVKRMLSSRPFVYLGKVSYGTYLWHWLVILVVARTVEISSIATIAIACLVATALASLSFEMLERPVRLSALLDRHRRVVIAAGLAISVVSALVIVPSIVDPAHATAPTLSSTTTAGFISVPANLDWKTAGHGGWRFVTCLRKPAGDCIIIHGSRTRVLLMGDSHAWMLIPALVAMARREKFTLAVSVRGGCPWQRDLYVQPVTLGAKTLRTEDCAAQKEDMYKRVIPALNPTLIVLMNLGHENPTQTPYLGPDGKIAKSSSPALNDWLQTTSSRSLAELRAPNRKILVVEPVPIAPYNTLTCLSKAKVLEQCRYVTSAAPDSLELIYRELAKRDSDVRSADFDRLMCPFLPICDPIVNGQIVTFDGKHLTPKFAKSLSPKIHDYLRQIGFVSR